MGNFHAQSVLAHGASITAVHDVRMEAAELLAEECGASLATDNMDRFFGEPMDGLILTTPPAVREEPIRRACEKSLHLMIEKPPAMKTGEGRRCLEQIQSAGVIAAVGFQLRYSPLYEKLRRIIDGHPIHLVRTVCTIDYYLNFSMSPWFLQKQFSGGPIAEQAIHLLDCARYLLGNAKPIRASAFGTKNMAMERDEFDAENSLQLIYELDNGVIGGHMNHCGHENFSFDLELIGPHLRLEANTASNTITGYLEGNDVKEATPEQNSIGLNKTGAWLRAIETGDAELIRSDYADSLNTLALVEAAVASLDSGHSVSIQELSQQ